MRLLANENIPGDAVAALRAVGHDVAWVRSDTPGSTDLDVLARAMRENRVLLTFDKDFGELAWRRGLPVTCGVILFRLPMPPPSAAGRTIAEVVSSRDDWPGQFAVIEAGRIPYATAAWIGGSRLRPANTSDRVVVTAPARSASAGCRSRRATP
jgi:Domain of unknown function (DUF5615)